MAASNGMASVVNKTPTKGEQQLSVPQEMFDLKTILSKVGTANVSEPDIPTKSSNEILSELFGAFNAEPPKILECVEQIGDNGRDVAVPKVAEQETSHRNKKNKRSKKKHKHKEKKHKKKTKSSKKQGSNEDSDATSSGGRKRNNPSERKNNEKKKVKGISVNEPKLMPTMEPVSIKITNDGNQNVKRTVECLPAEPISGPANDSSVSVKSEEPPDLVASSPVETKATNGMPPAPPHIKQMTADTKARPGQGRIIIKNLKFSSVYEEMVRQVEEQAKLKAERYEEGELSEDSSDNKETPPAEDDPLVLSPEHSSTADKKEQHRHCQKHSTTDDKHCHHHHDHNRSSCQSCEKQKRSHSSGSHGKCHSHRSIKGSCSPERNSSHERHNKKRSQSISSHEHHNKKSQSSSHEHHNKKSQSSSSHERHNKNRSRSISNHEHHNKKRSRSSSSREHHNKKSRSSRSREHHNKKRSRSSSSREHRNKKRSRSSSHECHKKRSRSSSRECYKKRSQSSSRERHKKRSLSSSSHEHHNKKSRSSSSREHHNKKSQSSSSREHHNKKKSQSHSRKRARHSRSRSRHRSCSLSAGHIDKQKLLEIARKNAMNLLKQGVLPSSVVTQDKMVTIKAGGKSVAELTDFCKQLSKKEALGQVSSESELDDHHSSGSDTERPFHHPFQIKERPASIVMNIRNSVQLPVKTLQEKTAEQSKQLRIQFPVSSGQQHRKSENVWVPVSPKKEELAAAVVAEIVTEPRPVVEVVNQVFPSAMVSEGLDIGSIVSQRLMAMRKLQENPNDMQALSEMYRAQKDMQMWAESKQQPGQFTGSTGVRVLSAAELASGFQAWAKKDQLTTASPVSGGMGMALLQKMGWRPGEGLGKNKEGTLEPLQLEIKMDKKGLVSQEELGHRPVPPTPTTKTLVGKHPVSLLVEFCSKRRWGVPQFELCFECGPDHRKNFVFKVRVNGSEYKPSVASPNKKQAKAEAATICLQALGVLPP